ncbi:IS4 family transposase ISDha2 [Collibacillus ludicampi]|uniref:IS4 family transposase ISDha2 n=1 Tax=Collibacillus ludicampi TaxID=2771369 RepID=A0AAV4LF67_9BACL|nr:IS4 family transposase [Collibacillus ludicampi]GIM44726.1 IS4 family transposase ISDha2 [Collibacillus ludicampi]GIM45210.1 IS4 family transposase ISDha2 [Collibacillus ludicampi]GIM45835.1 IS4 family transposase ISDha2 [Collibacillus ludicampi]GIM46505.1 IS4 family transposase ISDha2 [Collibacillus ludicampi]GIM47306.1 IS4 family transposase ISDha2 [Collibacillus ludicampi]
MDKDKDTLLSAFGKWVEPLFQCNFQEKVDQNQQDKYAKKLTTKSYVLLFLHAILQKRESLRAVAADILNPHMQEFLQLDSISYSQLSRKHRQVDTDLLAHLFFSLVGKIQCMAANPAGRKPYKIIDSTTISLCLSKYRWASFRKTKAGIKIHVSLAFVDHDEVYPEQIRLTTAKPNDITQMDSLIDDSEAIYVFDRGYVDYKKFDDYCRRGIGFVTRLKDNATFYLLESQVLHESPVLADTKVLLGSPQKPMDHVLRLVEAKDSQGNDIRIITNCFDLSAEEISDIYRTRWAIELFFKWMKQHLRIKTFYGLSETAVWNQVYLALITYCLMILMKMQIQTTKSLLELLRSLKAFLWCDYIEWFKYNRSSKKRRR